MAGRPAATIDAAGHSLADPQGFKLASEAWRKQAAKPDISAKALMNAAYFFKLSDKEFTIKLLERAVGLEPANTEIGARLGDEYALAIMGVTMINKNGYPLGADPSLTQSAAAKQSREALTTSKNPYALAKAGYMLGWQGGILFLTRKLAFDPFPTGERALERAVSLAPGEPEVADYLKQFHALQNEIPSERRGVAARQSPNSPRPSSLRVPRRPLLHRRRPQPRSI